MNFKNMEGKKVLVTGGAGLLGTSLTKRLIDLGLSVTSTYFSRPPAETLKANYQRYDFTQYKDCLEATKGQDYVIICAVQASGVAGVRQSPTATILPNLDIHAGLLEACCENRIEKVVWISSSSVYQEAFYPIREDQLDLNQPTYELYQGIGWVYRYIEALARCYYDKRGLNIGVIRTTNIYGPYDRFDDQKSHVIPALIKRSLKKEEPFVVWGNGYTVRDFIYVDDLVEGVLKVLDKYCISEPINVSDGKPVSIKELVKTILEVCDHPASLKYDLTKPTAVPYRVLDNTKADTLLGKIDKTPLKEGIRKTVEWYRSSLARD
jgi:GDP-L-fucose synthase